MYNNKKLFLSAVSSEFLTHRNLLASDLKRPNLDVAVQEDFIVTGSTTLTKLDTYIRQCDAVIHLIGHASGEVPEVPAVAALLAIYSDFGTRLAPLASCLLQAQPGFSYTQWEAYLALYHGRKLYIYRPTDFELLTPSAPRHVRFVFNAEEAQSQKAHYQRICALGHDRGQFLNEERLSSAALRDLVDILPQLASRTTVRSTELHHTAERLIGRDSELSQLDAAWNNQHTNVLVIRAWGGMGKTSLVASWMAELAHKDWRGAQQVFDCSFYSQGTRDQGSASADTFIAEALHAFGDPSPSDGSPWDRGARLARLVGARRSLLVLDGLEPLQHPPGPMQGQLKDAAIAALLKGLAAQNTGLCIVTTREKVEDIKQHYGRSAIDMDLHHLSDLAGAALLHYAGASLAGASPITPDHPELQATSREVRGHGLTLQLLGQYLRLVDEGDILKRDTVRLADADQQYQNDATRPYGHAFKAMEAYEKWFASGGLQGAQQLAVLRMLSLFDRPAVRNCLEALRRTPVIIGLTEALCGLPPREWKLALRRLQDIHLITVLPDDAIDVHPLLREYFAMRLQQQQPDAWRIGHRRLFHHLCSNTKEGQKPSLTDLQPLYQAVAHGCRAGLQQDACTKVFLIRIRRAQEEYSTRKLGAFGFDLGAVACFFDTPWTKVSRVLRTSDRAWLMAVAAYTLRAMGRMSEAVEPSHIALQMRVSEKNWEQAAISASNLSELELTLGNVPSAIAAAEQSIAHADRNGAAFWNIVAHAKLADVLHQVGRFAEAQKHFYVAETVQAKHQPTYSFLYSLQGFRYCDLLLHEAEQDAWRSFLNRGGESTHIAALNAVALRANQTLLWFQRSSHSSILSIALDSLTLCRVALYSEMLKNVVNCMLSDTLGRVEGIQSNIDHVVVDLRHSGDAMYLPHGLLTRAWLRCLQDQHIGPDSAKTDLDEAWEIAERGPMPLFLADIHLHRARLFFREKNYPWSQHTDGSSCGPQDDLKEARRLVEKHGYGRRKEELEDAEAALRHWQSIAINARTSD